MFNRTIGTVNYNHTDEYGYIYNSTDGTVKHNHIINVN